MVQALSTDGADEPFYKWGLPRGTRSSKNFFDLHVCRPHPESIAIDPVTVSEQVARRGAPGECLRDLSCCPLGSRMFGDVEVNDAPALMSQNQEDKQEPEVNHRHDEKVD
jgi:hypothetical protein